ncbi:MAG: AAA family ATPase [Candidatus Micrarchaeaceae archaeon]
MLFDLNPKERAADLYDRKSELEELSRSLKLGERLTVVYGVRRIGKTSLIHVFLSKREIPYVFIDARKIYLEHASIQKTVLYELIATEFLNFVERMGLDEEESLAKRYPSMFTSKELTSMLKDINEWCVEKKMLFAIVFDEAQYLRFGGSIKYDMLLAWSVDNLANIRYILTGSEVGMLKDFLMHEDVKAPLYGRFRNEIVLGRFDKRTAEEFLSKGFEELGRRVSKAEIDAAVLKVGGLVGWLTYYGYYRGVKGMPNDGAIGAVFDEGSKIVAGEIESLIAKSRARYLSVLKCISKERVGWAEIKRAVTHDTGVISDTRLNAVLQSLVKFGIVERAEGDAYILVDQITSYAVEKMKLT